MIIVGYEKEKAEIKELKNMLLRFDNYKESGVRIPRGLLLCGEAGVGKTVLARSMADDGISIVELSATLCCDDEVPDAIIEAFENAKRSAPSILLLDELDKLVGAGGPFFASSNDMVKKILLAELDGLSDSDRVLVVATCNDFGEMGEPLIRPGRFDRILKIDLPDEETRKNILQEYFKRIKIKKNFDIGALARNTRGFSGASLECLVNEAGIIALQKEIPTLNEEDIRYVLNKMEFGALEKNPLQDSEALHRVAVHEAGHALVGMLLFPDNIFGASVMPQGESNGHIRFVIDKLAPSVSEIENEIAVLLAGRVAERYVFSECILGSCADIRNALVKIHFLATKEAAYGYEYILGGIRGESLSENTKMHLEQLVSSQFEKIAHKTEKLISNNIELYHEIVSALEEKFVLSPDELKEIMDAAPHKCAA